MTQDQARQQAVMAVIRNKITMSKKEAKQVQQANQNLSYDLQQSRESLLREEKLRKDLAQKLAQKQKLLEINKSDFEQDFKKMRFLG